MASTWPVMTALVRARVHDGDHLDLVEVPRPESQ